MAVLRAAGCVARANQTVAKFLKRLYKTTRRLVVSWIYIAKSLAKLSCGLIEITISTLALRVICTVVVKTQLPTLVVCFICCVGAIHEVIAVRAVVVHGDVLLEVSRHAEPKRRSSAIERIAT